MQPDPQARTRVDGDGSVDSAQKWQSASEVQARSVNVLQRLGMSFLGRQEWQGLDRVFYTLSRDEFEEFHSDADD
ncbi:MAG: hypothetical protein IH848_05780 [Acidobacteria bacterium]|nr:hypothetical protein [Acidobacteriota bacterium]